MADVTVPEPFPIFKVANRYLLYDINTVTYIRREHHICGVLIGNIPQANQQNIFSGIPLELMLEEARLLAEKGHTYIVDDVAAHKRGLKNLDTEEKTKYMHNLDREGFDAAIAVQRQAEEKKMKHFQKVGRGVKKGRSDEVFNHDGSEASDKYELFDSPRASPLPAPSTSKTVQPLLITPTTSSPLFQGYQNKSLAKIPEVPSSYPLFSHLHSKGYFISPGLRFGCQYLVYPGDPLRFHSHFLAVAYEWDEEIDLLDIVGGGRLGTGVKKGYLVGGVEPKEEDSQRSKSVRTLCFEWAAM